MENAKSKDLNDVKHDRNKYLNNAPINDNKISRKMILSSFQKYKNKSLKHYNKMNKIFDTHVASKSKVYLSTKGC